MRVFIGLAALAAVANAQTTVVVNKNPVYGSLPGAPPVGSTALAQITVQKQVQGGAAAIVTPTIAASTFVNSNNYAIYVASTVSAISFTFLTNSYTGQMQYRWSPNYPSPAANYPNSGLTAVSYTCDPCSDTAGNGTPISCNTSTGPGTGASPAQGFSCSNLNRNYLLNNLQQSTPTTTNTNSFAVQLLDIQSNPAPNTSSYSFIVVRLPPAVIVGDPQIVGMQGQDFQVHGMPDEIFNMVSYPTLQVNARFTYLESAACLDNYTACFAHPGTYITEEGFRVGKDKIRVTAGSFKKGLTVHVNGKKIKENTDLTNGSVEIVNHRRAIVKTDVMQITVTNSDKFMNQELSLQKTELIQLGAKRRVLKDNERFQTEVPLHGLQGQTWRNVEYPSGLEYEGSIMDYHVASGNLFGVDFVFNQYQQ